MFSVFGDVLWEISKVGRGSRCGWSLTPGRWQEPDGLTGGPVVVGGRKRRFEQEQFSSLARSFFFIPLSVSHVTLSCVGGWTSVPPIQHWRRHSDAGPGVRGPNHPRPHLPKEKKWKQPNHQIRWKISINKYENTQQKATRRRCPSVTLSISASPSHTHIIVSPKSPLPPPPPHTNTLQTHPRAPTSTVSFPPAPSYSPTLVRVKGAGGGQSSQKMKLPHGALVHFWGRVWQVVVVSAAV